MLKRRFQSNCGVMNLDFIDTIIGDLDILKAIWASRGQVYCCLRLPWFYLLVLLIKYRRYPHLFFSLSVLHGWSWICKFRRYSWTITCHYRPMKLCQFWTFVNSENWFVTLAMFCLHWTCFQLTERTTSGTCIKWRCCHSSAWTAYQNQNQSHLQFMRLDRRRQHGSISDPNPFSWKNCSAHSVCDFWFSELRFFVFSAPTMFSYYGRGESRFEYSVSDLRVIFNHEYWLLLKHIFSRNC